MIYFFTKQVLPPSRNISPNPDFPCLKIKVQNIEIIWLQNNFAYKKDNFDVLIYAHTDAPDIDISQNVRKEFGFGFHLYIDVCAVTCNIWQASLHLFFRSHGDTRVSMFFPVLQSNTIERYKIQVEVTSVQHLFRFYMEPDGISSTSISSFWLCGTKR